MCSHYITLYTSGLQWETNDFFLLFFVHRSGSSWEDEEDDVDFDPRLDPSALDALDQTPEKELVIVLEKNEMEDIVRDAESYLQSTAVPHTSAAGSAKFLQLFRGKDIQSVHILLQQLVQIDFSLVTTR